MTTEITTPNAKKKFGVTFWILFVLLCLLGVLLLLAISVPRMVPSQDYRCVANLKQLEVAKEQWEIENQKTLNDIPSWNALIGSDKYIKNTPSCPQGGKYTLNSVGRAPVCSLGTNVTPPHVLPE